MAGPPSPGTRHHQTCRGEGDSGRCDGGFGTLSGSYPETVEPGFFSDDAVEVRAEVAVEQGRVNVSVTSPEGDVTDVEIGPGNPAVLQGVAEVEFDAGDRAFDVTFEALDEKASGISYRIDYRPVPADLSETGDGWSDATSTQASTDQGTTNQATSDVSVREGSLVDLLALAEAQDACFNVTVADFEALRTTVDAPAPSLNASNAELTMHLQTMSPGFVSGPDALVDVGGDRGVLLPLVRSSAYVANYRTASGRSEVFVGDFAENAFGQPTPDEVLSGVDTVPVPPPFGLSEATERLTVGNGTVTLASTPDAMAAALDAQRGDVRTLADVPLAVDMVSMLDELDVATGNVLRLDLSKLVDGEAMGLAAVPDKPGSWLLFVLYHPRAEDGIDAVTTTLAEEYDGDVVDVAARNGFAVATVRTDGPVNTAGATTHAQPL